LTVGQLPAHLGGTRATRWFLRPVTWQVAPQELLPSELTDDFRSIPRPIGGVPQLSRDVLVALIG
jgi:hypothetical protein